MEKPLPTHIRSLLLSAGLVLGAHQAYSQTSQNTQIQVGNILSGVCLPESSDISKMSQSYTIQSGDTFSGIASRMGLNYSDFILYLREFNPDIDIDAVIQVGDEFQILSNEVTQDEIDKYRYALEQRQLIEEIQRLSENGDYQTLKEYLNFEITPTLPVNLGVGRSYQTTADMYAQGLRTTSRSALPELENEAVCKHVLSQTLARFIGYNPSGIADTVRNIMLRENTPAWIIPYILETEGEYNRRRDLDLRDYFTTDFSRSRNAIIDSNEPDYSSGLLRQLEFLRTSQAVGCFIPTLYHGTSYANTALLESKGRDVNSHIFACNGFSYSDSFSLSKYGFLDALSSGNLSSVLVEMTRDLGVIGRYQRASDAAILSGLSEIYKYVLIEVETKDGKWTPVIFDENFEITNLSNILVNDIVSFRTGGNILTDGFQITPNGNDTLIEQRLTPDWIIYASHYFSTFHPTSILTAPESLLTASADGIVGRYVDKIDILRFFDITGEELRSGSDIRSEYYNAISKEVYGSNYSVLDVGEKSRVERLYAAHSLGLQILGYHSFNGTDWNPGATNINAGIPFLNIFTDEDISRIESIYAAYIHEKRQEYRAMIAAVCMTGTHVPTPVFYFKYFPGETTTSLWNTLNTYVYNRSPELAQKLSELLPTQRLPLIEKIFGTEVASGNITSGEYLFVDAQKTIQTLEEEIGSEFIGSDYLGQLSHNDRDLVNVLSQNTQIAQALAYFMIKEGYVPGTWYQFDDGSYDDIIENFLSRLKRKDQKRYYSWLSDNQLLATNQNTILWIDQSLEDGSISTGYASEFLLELRDTLDRIPSHGPNSWGDFQMRFTNLLSSEFAFERWPSSDDLSKAIDLIINPNQELAQILDEYKEQYPKIYEQDFSLVMEIYNELNLIAPNGEQIYALLTRLMKLNDNSNTYLLGKIISISLSQSLHRENITHICEQLGRVGETCNSLSDKQLESVYAYSMLTMNKGPNVALSIASENYLWRVFESINSLYPEIGIPNIEIRQEVGITTKPVLNYFEFRRRVSGSYGVEGLEDMEGYIDFYTPYIGENTDIAHLVSALTVFIESEEERSQKHYTLLSDTSLQDILSRTQRETFIYPTTTEKNALSSPEGDIGLLTARRSLFAYINERNIEGFISEPAQKNTDFLAPFLIFILYGQSLGAIGSATVSKTLHAAGKISGSTLKLIGKTLKNIALWRYRRFKKDLNSKRENIQIGKENRRILKLVNIIDGGVSKANKTDLDSYIEKRILQTHVYSIDIISNQLGSKLEPEYYDGFYRIGKDEVGNDYEGIHDFKAGKKYEEGLMFTNQENAIGDTPYEDGRYITYKTYTQGVLKTIMLRVGDILDETKNQSPEIHQLAAE